MNKPKLSTIFVFVILAIVIPIFVNVSSDLISNRLIDESEQQVKFSSVNLNFWLDSVGKTEFERGQKVIAYYKVDASSSQPLFFSLFNRTYSGEDWSPLLEYDAIDVGKLYSFPSPKSKNELFLEAGTEYFLAVVSAKPNDVLARKELVVEVH